MVRPVYGNRWLFVMGALSVHAGLPTSVSGQQAGKGWEKAAGGKQQFEVASVRLDTGEFKVPSFPLSNDDSYMETGGLFHADFPLVVYIQFAYKLPAAPEQLPDWASKDRFLVEGRAEGHPTKDQYRMMMQSLLDERFGFKMHFESKEEPVYAMVQIKPGKLGPNLQPHSDGPACDATPPEQKKGEPPNTTMFPGRCAVYALTRLANRDALWGSRDTTTALIAESLPTLTKIERPVVDHTGLTDRYDFRVEFSMEATRAQNGGTEAQPEVTGTPLLQAFEEQLGLKLIPAKAVLTVPVVDSVARPTEN